MLYVRECPLAGQGVSGTASRRQSILEATILVVGRRGYRRTTVADLIAEAGVSRTTFYNHFGDRHECFLAAYEVVVGRVLATVTGACAVDRPWAGRSEHGLAALVELFAGRPELARTALVEVAVAGGEARRRQQAAVDRLAGLLNDGAPGAADRPAATGKMAIGAVAGLLFDEIQAGRAGELPRRLPDLLFALLVPYLGPHEASRCSASCGSRSGRRSVAPAIT